MIKFTNSRYGRYRKNIEKTTAGGGGGGPQGTPSQQQQQPMMEPSLIDFGIGDVNKPDVLGSTTQQVTSKMSGLGVTKGSSSASSSGAIPKPQQQQQSKKVEPDDTDFDMFAQSRTTSYEKSKSR